jgi:hypothetical protein
MRRLLTWLVVTLGIAALVRKLRRRPEAAEQKPVTEVPAHEPPPAATSAAEPDPADALRQKLAETRTEPEDPQEAAPAGNPSVDERRATVYEQGRSALDEMKDPDEG